MTAESHEGQRAKLLLFGNNSYKNDFLFLGVDFCMRQKNYLTYRSLKFQVLIFFLLLNILSKHMIARYVHIIYIKKFLGFKH